MILAQADTGAIIGITGPATVLMGVAGFFLKAWLDTRKDKREGKKSEQEADTGAVETTGKALGIVRAELVHLGEDLEKLRNKVRERDKQIDELEERVEALEDENARLRRGARNARQRETEPRIDRSSDEGAGSD